MDINQTLQNRLAHGFAGMISHPPGWDEIVEELHNELVKIIPDYKAFQTKQKFGTLRFYIEPLPGLSEETYNRIFGLIREAEAKSAHTCEECGQPGKLRGNRFVRTLCDKCGAPFEEVALDTWESDGGLDPESL